MIPPQSQIALSHAFENLLEQRRNAERTHRDLVSSWHTLILETKKRTRELEAAFYQVGETPFSSEETIVPGSTETVTELNSGELGRLPSPLSPVTSQSGKTTLRLEGLRAVSTEKLQRKIERLVGKYQEVLRLSRGLGTATGTATTAATTGKATN